MLTLSHNQCSYSNPLYNMVASIRHKLNTVNKVNAIRTAPYLGDCSARNSYDELKDNNELCSTHAETETEL